MPICKMEISDIPAVLAIQDELRFQEWKEKQFASEINASYACCIVYESDESNESDDSNDSFGNFEKASCNTANSCGISNRQIQGYAIFHILGPDSELLSIATRESAQHKGIGQKLLDAGFAQLDFSAGDCCFLEVRDGNAKARRFYEKNGFTIYGTRKKYYADGEDAILYKR